MEENTVAIIDNSFNIFENMPEELVDEIFKHCAINSNNEEDIRFVMDILLPSLNFRFTVTIRPCAFSNICPIASSFRHL